MEPKIFYLAGEDFGGPICFISFHSASFVPLWFKSNSDIRVQIGSVLCWNEIDHCRLPDSRLEPVVVAFHMSIVGKDALPLDVA